jgi:hypothetical protein
LFGVLLKERGGGCMYYEDYKVACNRDQGKIYTMPMEYIRLEDGKKFYMPCNGCEEFCGDNSCKKCIGVITKLFRETEVDVSEVISVR